MTKAEVERLIAQGEGSTLEFEEKVPSPETIARLIASFANAEGGIVLFGIREPHEIVGIENEERLRKTVSAARQMITGEVEVNLEFAQLDGETIGVLAVESSKGIVGVGGGYHKRVGATSRPMSADEIHKHLAPARTSDPALSELAKAVAQQTLIIEQLREDFRKANSPMKKIIFAVGGAVGGALLKYVIEHLLA